MRNFYLLVVLVCLTSACRHKSLNEQLAVAFTTHLKIVDPDAQLDSVRVLWSTPVNERLVRTIDDTVYVREYNRIKCLLSDEAREADLRQHFSIPGLCSYLEVYLVHGFIFS
jgi:hypothetical protein